MSGMTPVATFVARLELQPRTAAAGLPNLDIWLADEFYGVILSSGMAESMADPLEGAESSAAPDSQQLTESTDLQALLSAILGDSAETSTPGDRPADLEEPVQVSTAASEPTRADPVNTSVDSATQPSVPLSFRGRAEKRFDQRGRSVQRPEGRPVPFTAAATAPAVVAPVTTVPAPRSTAIVASPELSIRSSPPPAASASGDAQSAAAATPLRWRGSLSLVAIGAAGLIALWFGARLVPAPSRQVQPKSGAPAVAAVALQGAASSASLSTEVGAATADLVPTSPLRVKDLDPAAASLKPRNEPVDPSSPPGATPRETVAIRANHGTQVDSSNRTSARSLPAPEGPGGTTSVAVPSVTLIVDAPALVDSTPQLPDRGREPTVPTPTPTPPKPAASDSEPGAASREPALAAETQPAPLPALLPAAGAAAPLPALLTRPARLVSRGRPVTRAAGSQIETGVVNVRVTLDATGKVTAARGVTGPMVLRDIAEDAARRSRFEPALRAGVATSGDVTLTYTFTRPANDVRTRTR